VLPVVSAVSLAVVGIGLVLWVIWLAFTIH
jgi:hypothetical protein